MSDNPRLSMQPADARQLEDACRQALAEDAPPALKALFRELRRRDAAYAGNEGWLYSDMPADRPHPCHEKNRAGIPVAWLLFDRLYGWSIWSTNVYGDGAFVEDVRFCPFCGEELPTPGEGS